MMLRIIITLLVGRASDRVRSLVDLRNISKNKGFPKIGHLCARWLESYGIYISSNAAIGPGLRLPHPTSIVIGDGVEIGENVTIYQGVTLGGRIIGDWKKRNYPKIADNSVIFAGAVIVGKVKIGRNCIIGANSVVTGDVPDNSTAVGAPARVVKVRH